MDRSAFIAKIEQAFQQTPVVAVLGPPECGKTFLAKQYAERHGGFLPENYFDLSHLPDLQRLGAPQLALSQLSGLIILDEVQHFRHIYPILRAIVDEPGQKRHFLLLSSVAKSYLKQPLDSLHQRITYLELGAAIANEAKQFDPFWLRGGFPESLLAVSDDASFKWRESYARTAVERYLPNMGIRIDAQSLMRFWMMLSHYHGEIFNASEIARSMDLTHNTMQSYARALTNIFMIRELQPWHENISKRQVKSRKIYFRDTGIYHQFLGIKQMSDLLTHPKLASSWRGLALESLIRHHGALADECYFWATQGNATLDLMIVRDGKRVGYQLQYSGTPKLTRSLGIALSDLKLDELTVVYPGKEEVRLSDRIYGKNLLSVLGRK